MNKQDSSLRHTQKCVQIETFKFKILQWLSDKTFKNSTVQSQILTMELEPRLVLKASLCVCLPTFITEAIHLVTKLVM